ncbi:hypothetical protein ANANG_G00193130 [Anguilla anguilla]|uniref:Myb-like domain-containing protein n=1 Tax=Anguilla anguilla TaxID=7936 RepID=A0A9D3M1I1_ANGAN|nr:hypothetical protein ANANG_G00193130 [Anguilla anguilla]
MKKHKPDWKNTLEVPKENQSKRDSMSVTVLQINTDSPLLFMDAPEANLTTGHQNQQGKERKEEKKHKKKKHKRHMIDGADVMLETTEMTVQELSVDQDQGKERKEEKKHKKKKHKRHMMDGADVMLETAEMTEQELSVDQEQGMERKKKKKKKEHKHQAEDCGVSTEVKGKEKKNKQIEHGKEVNGLETFELEEHILKERKKTKSSCDQSEVRAQCETVAGAGDGAEVYTAEGHVSEPTVQKVLQERKKKKKKKEKSSDKSELSIQCKTEDGTEAYQQEEEILQKKKKKKGNRSCDQTELSIHGETEDGRESSQQEVEIPQKKKKKKGNHSCDQTELSIHGETEDGTESSQQEVEIPQKKKRKKGNRSSDQTELSIHGETEDGTESSQQEVEVPEQTPKEILQETKKRKKKREGSCGQTESNVQGEIEDDSGTSKQREDIPEQIPLGILREKKKRNGNSEKTGLSIQSEIKNGNKSSQNDEELPLVKNRKRSMINRKRDQTESSFRTGVKDGAKASRQGRISKKIPLVRTRVKKKSGETSSDQKEWNAGMKNDETQTEIFEDKPAVNTLDIEQSGDDWELKRMEYIDELKEFIPNVEKKSAHTLVHLMKYDLLRFREFKKAGVSLRHGRYSNEEVTRLMKNVEDFLALTGIDSGTKLFFPSRFPEEMSHIVKMKREYKFHLRMSDGICRPWHDIYSKGRKLFDFNKMGRFTDDEVNSLQKLYTLHGNNWMKIAEITGRSSHALEKRYSQLSVNKGRWTEDEMQSLEGALRDHLFALAEPGADGPTIRRDQLYRNLPWTKVAQRVGTRSWDKCRAKWMTILKKRMAEATEQNPGCDSSASTIRLIRTLYELEIEDAADINWEDLTKVFGDVTPHYVQTKFHRLKTKWVPRWQAYSFGEIIDFLYEKALPQLEEKLQLHTDEPEREMEDVSNQQESFLLSKIFSDI